MGKRTKFGKYSRRTSLDNNGAKLTPIIISIAVFVLLCVVISVVVGLLLGKKAESIGFVSNFEISEESYYSGDKLVSPVEAYYYEPGMKVGTYVSKGITDFSLCLRHSDGSLAFDTYSFASEGYEKIVFDDELVECVEYIHDNDGRVCAYFYVTSFSIQDPYLREMYKSYELVLINEAVKAGVDDIMLVGLNIGEGNIDEAVDFASRAALCSSKTLVGVLVSPEVVKMTADGYYWAARLKQACDYLALDMSSLNENADEIYADVTDNNEENAGHGLSELELFLEETHYYINSYSMRIVLSKENSSLYDSIVDLGASNIQVIGD